MLSSSIHITDYIVISIYIIGIFTLAFYSGKTLKSAKSDTDLVNQQYLAGKSLTFWESLFSIIATEVSALTFLGIPAFAYGGDFSFIQIYMGAIFGRITIALVFLPKIYDKGLTIYATMARENGTKNGQRFTAIFYFINKILAVGVRLFSGSIMIAEFFNLSIYMAVFIICVITFFYTLIGGLKAVVRTDMAQMGLFILGGFFAHYVIPQVDGRSWTEMISIAISAGKTSFFDFSNPWPFVTGVIGGILFDMATHGVDQDFAQRLTANRSLKSAQKAIVISSFLSIAVGLLFLSIGSLLWVHYQQTTAPSMPNDKLFAYFITQNFPIGLKGLMVAGVLAATMSTLDSTINALSACFYNDIISHRVTSHQSINKFYKIDTFIISFLLMIIAFIASSSDGVLILGLKITSWTAGSLLALFFATVIWPKWIKVQLNSKAVFGAYIFGIAAVYLNNNILKWAWQWNVYFAFFIATIWLMILAKLSEDTGVNN